MKKKGRPTKFKRDFIKLVYFMASPGMTDIQMAEALGVTQQTFDRWKKKHIAFCVAIQKGKKGVNKLVAASSLQSALGYDYTTKKIIKHYEGEGANKHLTGSTEEKIYHHKPGDTRAQNQWMQNRKDKGKNKPLKIDLNIVPAGKKED